MFDPYRKFVTCIFCGKRGPLTREHLFGDSFAQFLRVEQNWVAPQIVPKRAQAVQIKRGSSPITHVAPPLLCGACNSGQLGLVMSQSLPLLKKLCTGEPTDLTGDDRIALRRYCERFGSIVDVCTSSEQVEEMTPQQAQSFQAQLQHQKPAIVSFAARSAWLQGAALESVKVYVGHHQGILGLNPDFNVTHQPEFDGSWKRITFIVWKLAVCIDIGQPDLVIPTSFVGLSELQHFPVAPAMSYDDYLALRHQDQPTLYLRTFLRFPEIVRNWEAHVRSGKRPDDFWE